MVEKTVNNLNQEKLDEIPDKFFENRHEKNLGGDFINSVYEYSVESPEDDDADVQVVFQGQQYRIPRSTIEELKEMDYDIVGLDKTWGRGSLVIRLDYNGD